MTITKIKTAVIKSTPIPQSGLFFSISLLIFSSLFFLSSCKTVSVSQNPSENELFPEKTQWKPIADDISDIEQLDFYRPGNNLSWHAVRINLEAEGLIIHSFPDSRTASGSAINNPAASVEVCCSLKESQSGFNTLLLRPKGRGIKPSARIKLRDFAIQTDSVVAMNTTPFTAKQTLFNVEQHPLGLYITDKKIISDPLEKYAALLIRKKIVGDRTVFKAQIIDSQKDLCSPLPDYAFGGYWTILRGNKIYQFKNLKDARTVCGINNAGSILFLLTVEGSKGNGLSFMECARIMQKLGADTAMEFDGGSSSGLIINGQTVYRSYSHWKTGACMGFEIPKS